MSREREASRAMRAANFNPASRTTDQIVEHCAAGLISIAEARFALRWVANRAQYDADYSDSPASYKRHNSIAECAMCALAEL